MKRKEQRKISRLFGFLLKLKSLVNYEEFLVGQ